MWRRIWRIHVNLRPENAAPKVLISVVIHVLHAYMAYLSLIRHSIVIYTSLSLPRCRHHLVMKTWLFLFFCGHLSWYVMRSGRSDKIRLVRLVRPWHTYIFASPAHIDFYIEYHHTRFMSHSLLIPWQFYSFLFIAHDSTIDLAR